MFQQSAFLMRSRGHHASFQLFISELTVLQIHKAHQLCTVSNCCWACCWFTEISCSGLGSHIWEFVRNFLEVSRKVSYMSIGECLKIKPYEEACKNEGWNWKASSVSVFCFCFLIVSICRKKCLLKASYCFKGEKNGCYSKICINIFINIYYYFYYFL